MDWADDVAYSVHDVEDARASPGTSTSAPCSPTRSTARACSTWPPAYAADADADELGAALDRLHGAAVLAGGYDGSLRDLAALKNLTCSSSAGSAGPPSGPPATQCGRGR